MNVIVSIGRNIKDIPMAGEFWNRFKQETLAIVRDYTTTIYFVGSGRGEYEGVVEDSYTIVGEVSLTPTTNVDLVDRLSYLAWEYGQESIAVTFGNPIFAGAK